MRSFFAFGVLAFSAAAQVRTAAPVRAMNVAPPSAPALGGKFASGGMSRPLGGVPFPTFPGTAKPRSTARPGGLRYFGPVYYVPNAFDYADYSQAPLYSQAPPPPPPGDYTGPFSSQAPQPPPVIINQYFGPQQEAPAENAASAGPGGPLGAPENYYLIAYKNHEVYPALAYWVEDKTLHYVTTQNTHNQASLDLIDIDQTKKLNADRSVPFSIPGN